MHCLLMKLVILCLQGPEYESYTHSDFFYSIALNLGPTTTIALCPWTVKRGSQKMLRKCGFQGVTRVIVFLQIYVASIWSAAWFKISIDVGGGVLRNDIEQSLSNISLRWMVRQVIASGCDAILEPSALLRANINLDSEPTTNEIDSMDPTDALEPLHDELQTNVLWWLLEIFPFPYSWQDASCVWHKTHMCV